MPVARPNAVRVGAHEYKIYWSKESWKKYHPKGADGEKAHSGLCMVNAGIILINGWDQALSQQQDTLIHEILHACLALTQFSEQPIIYSESKDDAEEFIILLLTPVLHIVLQDNPKVLEWLTQ